MFVVRRHILAAAILLAALPFATVARAATDPENTLYLELPAGRVVIQMLPDVAPQHVKRIKELVRQGFYDGLAFHRVIPGFMAQTGDPMGNGTGGSGQTLPLEPSDILHERGTVSMARARAFNSADSQFFIVYDRAPHLDRMYTAWGRVVSGMEHVDALKKGDPAMNGMVEQPDILACARVAADVKGKAPGAATCNPPVRR